MNNQDYKIFICKEKNCNNNIQCEIKVGNDIKPIKCILDGCEAKWELIKEIIDG